MVRSPSDDVASCCQLPPAYEPSIIPAAEGEEIPVPPPPAPSNPARVLVNVSVFPEPIMVVDAVSPLKADEEVAKVIVVPDWVWPVGPIAVMPPPPEPQALPVFVTIPEVSTWRQLEPEDAP